MYEYQDISIDDLAVLTQLYCDFLNKGPSIEEQLRRGIESEDYIGIKCINESGNICGVFSAFKGMEFTCGHEDLVKIISNKYKDVVIYTAEMIVVIPECRHQGVAHELVARFNERLMKSKAEYFVAELWREPSGRVPGKFIFVVIGIEVEHIFYPEFYKELLKYELTCPICGDYCICGADICIFKIK